MKLCEYEESGIYRGTILRFDSAKYPFESNVDFIGDDMELENNDDKQIPLMAWHMNKTPPACYFFLQTEWTGQI